MSVLSNQAVAVKDVVKIHSGKYADAYEWRMETALLSNGEYRSLCRVGVRVLVTPNYARVQDAEMGGFSLLARMIEEASNGAA